MAVLNATESTTAYFKSSLSGISPSPVNKERSLKSRVCFGFVPHRKSYLNKRHNRISTQARVYAPSKEMSEEERRRKEEKARKEIEQETIRRSQELKDVALKKTLNSELKLGRVFYNEGQFDRAITHFDKVITQSNPTSRQYGEGVLNKAECLEKAGRTAEAHHLYETMIQFRAPFPDLKRRAVHGIQRIDGVTFADKSDVSLFEEYLNRLYSDGFATYFPKETKYVESEKDRLVIQLVTMSILLVGPVLAFWLVFNYFY